MLQTNSSLSATHTQLIQQTSDQQNHRWIQKRASCPL